MTRTTNININIALIALTLSITATAAHAQSTLLGTNDRKDAVSEFQYPGSSVAPYINTGSGTRPRGIDYDKSNDNLYVADSNTQKVVVYNAAGTTVKKQFAATVTVNGTNTTLTQLNDVKYRPSDKSLFADNAFVYSSPGGVDRNLYKFDTTQATPVGTVFGTLDSTVYAGNVYLCGIGFGKDGNVYVVQQTGGSGMGTGYLRRFNGTTGAYIDTVASFGGMFGVTFDTTGNLYVGSGNNIQKLAYTGLSSGNATYAAANQIVSNVPTDMICDVYVATDGYLYAATLNDNRTVGNQNASIFKYNPNNGNFLGAQSGAISGEPKTDFLTEIYPAGRNAVPEPTEYAFYSLLTAGVLSLIVKARRNKHA